MFSRTLELTTKQANSKVFGKEPPRYNEILTLTKSPLRVFWKQSRRCTILSNTEQQTLEKNSSKVVNSEVKVVIRET
jgi:hypothetical protein